MEPCLLPLGRMTPPSSRPILAAQKAYEADPPVIRDRVPAPLESGIVSAITAEGYEAIPEFPRPARVPEIGSAPDPTDILFDAVYELNFASSAWEAAGMCAATLARALGARTVVIHAHDLERRQLKAIGASGDGDIDIMGMSESSDDDLVASAVIVNQKPLTMKFDGELPRIAPHRLHLVGAPRTI